MLKREFLFIYIFSLLLVGCSNPEKSVPKNSIEKQQVKQMLNQELSEVEKQNATQAVRSLMQAYQDDMDALDAEKMLTHFMDSSDFVYTRNGTRRSYQEFVEGCRNLPKIFKKNVNITDSIYVDVITPDVAIATVAFNETLTKIDGEELHIEGTIAWTALKKNGKWLFIHGHSFREF